MTGDSGGGEWEEGSDMYEVQDDVVAGSCLLWVFLVLFMGFGGVLGCFLGMCKNTGFLLLSSLIR